MKEPPTTEATPPPAPPMKRKAPLPPRVTTFIVLCALAAAGAYGFSFGLVVDGATLPLIAGAALFAAGFLALERQAVILVWGRQRITSAITEVSILLGLLALPAPYLVLAVPVPRIAMAIATRRPAIKSLFNVAQGVLTVAAAGLAYVGATGAGLHPILAAVGATALYSLLHESLLALLFSILERASPWAIYRTRFLMPNLLAIAYGITGALVVYALFSVHPLAVIAAAPLLLILHRYAAFEARADREIGLYRELALQGQALVGVERKDVIAERVLATCLDCLGASKVVLRLENGLTWQRVHETGPPPGATHYLSTPVLGREGRRLGEIRAWRRPGRRSDDEHDEALVRIISIQTAQALENAEALFEVARQRDVVARQEKLSALGSLVAGVAHEVNNPLTYLSGNVELALYDLDDLEKRLAESGQPMPVDLSETRRLLTTALSGSQRIGEIVKALRAVARIKSGTDREMVPMNRIAQNVCELMRIGVPEQVVLQCEVQEQDPAVLGFSSELYQVVLNLAKNAVEASLPKGGTVVVAVKSTADRVELSVSDEGIGMSEDTRRRLFTPFFTTKGTSGTGLGLSIVNSIVRDHGGEITVDSVPGKGTTFRVSLPRAA